ncbi:MAG TPA: hypothetical protein VEP90_13655, partial [Methylomirabilota bacterium]|nr:hypothetical protein [Methylomirabilota bacterium]
MDEAVNISPPGVVDTPVYLADESDPVLAPAPAVAETRSQKAYIGLGDATGVSRQDMRAQIQSGQEQEFRQAAASNLTYQAAQKQDQTLIDARNKKGSALSYQEVLKIVDPFSPENKPADPQDVIEKAYSQKFISMANTAAAYLKGTVVDDAIQEVPEQLAL